MSYKIAAATSDGVNIDESFGSAESFDIYEVEQGVYHFLEKRNFVPEKSASDDCAKKTDCSAQSGGCGNGGGCTGASGNFPKVELIRDCRCVVCKKIGFNVQKQFEKLAITSFDVDCTVELALKKITTYLEKMDNHQSLRGILKTDGKGE
jgi:hypothetical protein